MANRTFTQFWQSLLKSPVTIAGSFAPNGSSAVASASVKGKGFTVARTGTGTFTVSFSDAFPKCISATASLQLASGDDKLVQVGAIDVAAKTMVLRVWDISGAAVADVAADANNRVNFNVVFSNSVVD